jgi:hypothetical protein
VVPSPGFENKSAGKSPQLSEGVVRAGCGFFAAPFAAGIVGAATGLASSTYFSFGNVLSDVTFGFGMGAVLAWAHLIFLGIPAHLLLRWRRVTSLQAYALLASTFGLVLPGLMLVNGSEGLGGLGFYGVATAMAAAGCAAGTLFWFIARPDQYGRTPPED